jgi:multicomponent Na+:H+ antiporter subunit C
MLDHAIFASLIEDNIVPKINYWIYIVLMMIGLYAMISKNNLIKKLIGMSIFQTAIILFYVSIGVKSGSGIPILSKQDQHAAYAGEQIDEDKYANPLPHVLMLTAIVVGVSTLGLALAISQKIFYHYGSVEEDEILAQIKTRSDADD